MNRFGNSIQNPPQLKGILKKPGRCQPSPSGTDQLTTTDKLRTLVEQISPSRTSGNGWHRNTYVRGASPSRSSPETRSKSTESEDSVDFDEFGVEAEHQVLERVSRMSECQACSEPLEEFEGYILHNCQQHIVCESCLYRGIQYAFEMKKEPTCPVDTCCAMIRKDEIEAIRAEDAANATNQKSGANQKDDKRPTSSTSDEAGDLAPSEEILLPRENETMIVAVSGRCDKCEKPVDKRAYLDIRKCKQKHKICFDCIRDAVKISKNLVRCPLYRDCKSTMARDEVMLARYEINKAEKLQKESLSDTRAKVREYIYPNGLPCRDLWPVLMSTTCSKCGQDVDFLNGIVIKQCNIHCVCVDCVRENIAVNGKAVQCPMHISCGSIMMREEVEAFIERFGGPAEA